MKFAQNKLPHHPRNYIFKLAIYGISVFLHGKEVQFLSVCIYQYLFIDKVNKVSIATITWKLIFVSKSLVLTM